MTLAIRAAVIVLDVVVVFFLGQWLRKKFQRD